MTLAVGFGGIHRVGAESTIAIGVKRDGTPITATLDAEAAVRVLWINLPAGVDAGPLLGFARVADMPTRGYPLKGESYNSPTDAEAQYLWRWIGMTAPDLVVEVTPGDGETWYVPESELPQLKQLAELLPNVKSLPHSDELVAQLVKVAPCATGVVPAVRVTTNSATCVETLSSALAKLRLSPSPARVELQKRSARSAKQIADELLKVYGFELNPVAYIPALAIVGRMRQEQIDGAAASQPSATVLKAVEPYVTGKKKTYDAKGNGSTVAGHLLFGELAEATGDTRYTDLVVDVANLAFNTDGKPREAMPSHNEMSDNVFMGCPILAQAGKLTGDEKFYDACLRNLRFMQKLCVRDDGIYRHSPLDEAAWGRGNGFPALGLAWSLDELPESYAGREEILTAHRKHLTALLPHQDATGCWHQVIDRPESYREFTCTAMIGYAMMRGVRTGRLDRATFAPAIEKAWEALKLRIAADGTLVDVCTGTGKQKSLRDYYDRGAILGRDGRGGAMALMVVTERELYEAAKQ
jgi:rhamnogalacturonyl hydrolase YesR